MKYIFPVMLFSLCYQYVHVNYLVENFDYMGYISNKFTFFDVFTTCIFLLLPLVVKPKKILFLDIAFSIFYFLLYIPIIITFLNSYENTLEIIYNQSFFVLGFILMFYIPKIKFIGLYFQKIKPLKFRYLIYICLIFIALLLFQYRNSYKIVSFDDVYKQRSDSQQDSVFFGYLTLWITYFFGPLLLANGLIKKNIFVTIFGVLSVVFIYGIGGSKISLFIPFLIIGIFFIYNKGYSIFSFLSYSFTGIILFVLSISKDFLMISSVILMRTFGIAGLLTFQYNEFFKKNDLTYFSHVNIVNFFSRNYPYDKALGFVVSSYYGADSDVNSNANFLATDGLASFGLVGVLIVSVLLGLYFSFTKTQVKEGNKLIFGIMIVPFSFIVLNVGLFTSILSGGFLFLNIYYLFFKSE
ncbi:oligosaccharide repeat unit polymerase [Flavobacterium sp. Root420]|uniref:oligosaccharide repeat unit polymerase n=1 Tax=Flavobacterium sp. Root420 TaxID=1736533 RepID=UPI000A6984E2|nr:oligosaccharide repeat unit polymerase [Flavobacterium sp. Root420]